MKDKIDFWNRPATIERNNFKYKSLSSFSYNIAVGCEHACRFCYVPEVSTNRMASKLAEYGVKDPDAEWGEYLMLRQWNEQAFVASLKRAEKTPSSDLNADGNRAVMLCSTTDPYQVVRHPDAKRRAELQAHAQDLVRLALVAIRDNSTISVRILTRSPLARRDFELMKSFGDRLLFGMSLPTLDNRLAKVYEPKAPAPTQRLETLKAAKKAGLNVYVAMAPTYPECDDKDLRATLEAIRELDPVTVFHEPINIRAENVRRIEENGKAEGVELDTKVFESTESWREYALDQLLTVESIAHEIGLGDRLHLWPDQSLGSQLAVKAEGDPEYLPWLKKYWNRVSEWPKGEIKQ